jgi:hypothetical protein
LAAVDELSRNADLGRRNNSIAGWQRRGRPQFIVAAFEICNPL